MGELLTFLEQYREGCFQRARAQAIEPSIVMDTEHAAEHTIKTLVLELIGEDEAHPVTQNIAARPWKDVKMRTIPMSLRDENRNDLRAELRAKVEAL